MVAASDKEDRPMHAEAQCHPKAVAEPEQDASFSALEKRITRKTDLRLLPILASLYTISLIDRTNLGASRISGIDEDLGLAKGNRYSVAVLVFYVGYIIFELPSNLALKKFGAAVWLAILGLAFGLVTVGISLIHNYKALVALRVLLGAFEAGLFPGCLYLISAWYRRYEVQKRIAFFYSFSSFMSSFANILAYGLTQIADDPERHGWRYIFIVQGSLTCGVAILTWFIVVDFPDSKRNKFLTEEEKEVLRQRLISERGDAEAGKVTFKVIAHACKQWHIWAVCLIYMGSASGLYAFLFFLPVILRNSLGFSQVQAFCLTAPPAAFAVVINQFISWAADKTRMRGPYAFLECVIAIVGLAMTGFLTNPIPRYIGTFLGMGGTTALISTTLAWAQNNVFSDADRSVITVIQVCHAALGGIYSALVFRQQDAPNYVPGIIGTGALFLLGAIMTPITSWLLWKLNREADRGKRVIENNEPFRYTW
ncbi:major facilitator superfamily domain-containing protein [Fusarium solani]|uniref:Major facilitator superfamily domain-containing protein n=1 Tax=Fusarium solani TaxID=169388 RepID=A0A9P9GRF2_FUSSL|nr:major facilitator superfamily domain-containing protein [Fusarium solani]KAH7242889.1 major facilitator superfamily domain-containing protein [Fusarium solani]